MSDSGENSTYAAYARLWPFVRRYSGRLAVGVIAGLCFASTVFGLLQAAGMAFSPFSTDVSPAARRDRQAKQAGDDGSDMSTDTVERVERMAEKFGVPIAGPDGQPTWQFLLLALAFVPPLVMLRTLADYLNRYYTRWVASRVIRDLRDALFRSLGNQSLKFFGGCDIGQLIGKSTADTGVVESVMATTVSDITRAPMEIVSAVAFLAVFSVKHHMVGLVSLVFVAFPLCVVPIVVLGHYVRRYTHRALHGISGLVSRMHETFTGIRIVKAFNTEETEARRFEATNGDYFRAVIKALRAELLMAPLMEGIGILMACAFFAICFARGVKLYQILSVVAATVMVYRPVKQLARINASLQRGAAALDRIFSLLDVDTALVEAPRPVKVDGIRDRFVFDHVDFSYAADGPPVLRDICLEVPRGSVVALVGETGSGKTTLANLLARFYDPTGGRVTLDGIDLREVEIASLRRLVGVVTQETILFNDTIANNISYGSEGASMELIVEAARKANAHDFISAAPAGYGRVVGEKGFVLSGGERQRIAIARAILRNPPVLILDEATSALDTVTERLVQDAIAKVMKDRTVLAIAHRLSTVRSANLIVLLDHGGIAERGTHDELYRGDGRYRSLCDMQLMNT